MHKCIVNHTSEARAMPQFIGYTLCSKEKTVAVQNDVAMVNN